MYTHIYFKKYNVDADLDASENGISSKKPSSVMLNYQPK